MYMIYFCDKKREETLISYLPDYLFIYLFIRLIFEKMLFIRQGIVYFLSFHIYIYIYVLFRLI